MSEIFASSVGTVDRVFASQVSDVILRSPELAGLLVNLKVNPLILPDNTNPAGYSLDTRDNGGVGGSINLSGAEGEAGGSINLSAAGEGTGGSINMSGQSNGVGGSINMSASGNDSTGGSINLSGTNDTGIGGSINLSGDEGVAGSINMSSGNDGNGGSIDLSNGGGSIGRTAGGGILLNADGGVRMPNRTTSQKNAIDGPAAGLMVFDTTLGKLAVYTGSAWQTITST